ncbi:MAG: ABC-F family ATP-binding cassette domain-containing protein [Planctomycetes bacterium]|nr:ABC-F family ATP-binding cassette domain-containing protein [Planctomycetota bacterium]
MPVITFSDVCKSFGSDAVFDGLGVHFFGGEKVGMVGANGSGKSTLLKLILGDIEVDSGKVFVRKGLRIGYLPQEPIFDDELTVLEEMRAGFCDVVDIEAKMHDLGHRLGSLSGRELKAGMKEYDRLSREFELVGGYVYESRIKSVLAGLGIGEELHEARISALSGGQLSRLGLARALVKATDFLLLDEPTNHLDLQATVWLEGFLRSYKGAAIVISHDRYLLDGVACKIVEISGRGASVWKGNYSTYVRSTEIVRLEEQRRYEKRSKMVAKTLDFIARNKDQEGMRKTARGRKKRLERLLGNEPDYLDRPTDQRTVKFAFGRGSGVSELVLRCEGVGKSFGDLVLFENLSFDVLSGERWGITGPNGTGKSTLINMALGRIETTSGTIRMGRNVSVGYLDQHGKELDVENTVLQEAWSVRRDLTSEAIRDRLGAFLFSGEDVFKQVGDLSGGQQNRLMLCKLVLGEPDVLVLDEPTNHLDIASREMLEEALTGYKGTIIAVSHDRFFLDKVADRLLVIGTDEVGRRRLGRFQIILAGGEAGGAYSRYNNLVKERLAQREQAAEKDRKKKARRSKDAGPKSQRAVPHELKKFNKYSLEEIEEMIIAVEGDIKEMQEDFGQEKVYQNPELLMELQSDFDRKKHELDLLYRAYELREG